MGCWSSRVEGKSVLVTGTSTGIGLATATLLANDGWIVFAGVRKQQDFDRLQQIHTNIRPIFLDVTKPEQIAAAIETVRTAVGESGLDALVNNAGGGYMAPVEFMAPEEFEYAFQVLLFGVFRLTQAAIPLLRTGKPGMIINISSMGGRMAMPLASAYNSAKHALEAFSSILRQELKSSRIQVSVLGPGPVSTPFGSIVRERIAALSARMEGNEIYAQNYAKRMQWACDLEENSRGLATSGEYVAKRIRSMLLTSWLRHRYSDCYLIWFLSSLYTWLPHWMTERISAALFY